VPGPAAGESERAGEQARVRIRDAVVPLGILLALGLVLRLIIAYVLLPGSGFGVDLGSFSAWAIELARNGPWGLYDRPIFVDYTPGYLYVLWALGLVSEWTGIAIGSLLKLPAIVADLALAVAVFALAAELGASRRAGLAAAAVVLFVPITWFDSAVWAQVDSIGTLVLVLAVRELWRGHSERAAILTTIAAIIKPQFGILLPLAAIVILRRHLVEQPADDTWLGRRLGGGPVRIATVTLAGLVTATLVCLPFGLVILPVPFLGIGFEDSLLGQIIQTAGGYPYVTVNAYNPWALVSLDGNGLATAGTWIRDAPNPEVPDDPYFTVLGAPAVLFGSLLIGAAIASLMVVLWRRHDDRRALLVALTVMAIAFFILPTRVHERYLYPFFALGAILFALQPRWGAVYGALAAANLANMYGILTLPFYDNPGLGPLLGAFGGAGARLGEAIRSTTGVWLVAITHTLGLVAAAAFLVRPAPGETDATDLDREEVDAAAEPGATTAGKGAEGSRALLAAVEAGRSAGAADGAADGAPASAPATEPAGDTADAASGPARWVAAVPAALAETEPPASYDRTASLAREGGGRLGRIDVWLVVVLVLAALFLRTFRLGEPMRMYFDEVYHARTAIEFLQHWRYGEPHNIYEYTHPHLAKYAMAAGIVLFGDNEVVATSNLGAPVRDVAIEPRWDDPGAVAGDPSTATQGGERLYVATGSGLEVHDLRTRERLASFPVAGAQAVAVDPVARVAYVGTVAGEVLVLDTGVARATLRGATPATLAALAPQPFADVGEAVERLWVVGEGAIVAAGTPGDGVATLDGATGQLLARVLVDGRSAVADAGTVEALVAVPSEVPDPATAADELAALLGGAAADYRPLLAGTGYEVTVASDIAAVRADLEAAIAEGRLPGLYLREVPLVAVAGSAGITFLEPATGRETGLVALQAPATGLVRVTDVDEPALWAAAGSELAVISPPAADTAASLDRTMWMPGAVERIVYNDATQLLHVLGRTPDGAASTAYVVEPRGSSVFADAVLPFEPAAWALDVERDVPSADRQQLLAFAADGASVAVDVGSNAFAWRLPGVAAGALMAGVLFLLARILFRRRSIAVIAGLFVLADGMLFAQSRIAMNDAYVALFIAAAVTVFAAFWTGAWRGRAAPWVGLLLVGLLLGLAFAAKWVALYAVGGIGLLILLRSALGRWLIVVGLAAISATLGYMAIATAPEATSSGNLTFLLLMIGLTLVAAAVAVLHPVAWTAEEVWIAVAAPVAAGAIVGLIALGLGLGTTALAAAVGLMALGGVAAGAFWLAARLGLGPLAPPPDPDDPAARLAPADPPPPGWLRPGWRFGLPVAWAAICLLGIPLAVYVAFYLPWAALGNQLWPGFPAGNEGQTLLDLTRGMYDYHNNLRATHAASSPWWAWPANLKPVWFYQDSFAGGTSAAIYDTGNLAIWWLSIPAFGFVAWQAYRRRSLALALVAIMVAALWLPWARIDRATFQYHYYTALPFVVLALAYFVAEVWHGPSRRTFTLARAAAAVAFLGPVLLWLLRGPLCAVVDVERANPGSQACSGAASLSMTVTQQLVGVLVVLGVAAGLVIWQLLALDRVSREPGGEAEVRPRLVRIGITAGLGTAALLATWVVLPAVPVVDAASVPGEVVALALSVVFAPLAWLAWHVAAPRRFALGTVLVAAFVFVLFYPNIAGLPLPTAIFNWYQGLLPTWLYPFQFPVNTDPAVEVSLAGPWPVVLFGAVLLAAGFVAYSAWTWRLALAERAAEEAGEATRA
jgi:dolichyl-phosphate-mannose--protein O-mannosyl transferase